MDCWVCGTRLQGDAAFLEHHLNSCLDRQNSSRPRLPSQSTTFSDSCPTSPLPTSSSLSHASDNPPSHASVQLADSTSSALAAALAHAAEEDAQEQRDREVALALARAEERERAGEQAQGSGGWGAGMGQGEEDEDETCPCCEARWSDIGLALSTSPSPSAALALSQDQVEAKRRTHVERCLDARGKMLGQFGGEGGGDSEGEGGDGHGTWEVVEREEAGGWSGMGSGKGKAKERVEGTAGLVPLLAFSLEKSHASSHGRTAQAFLAAVETVHISTRLRDWGWGCGYKNLQMLFTALRHLPCYAPLFASSSEAGEEVRTPGIGEWQEGIEAAWRAGHDPPGRAHFGGKLVNSRRWIGTTEVYTALVWVGVRAKIVDFPRVPGGEGTHQSLVRWIVKYFSSSRSPSPPSTSSSSHPTEKPNAFTLLAASSGSPVRLTGKQPLYLQHRGHSRTVVGVEVGKRSGGGSKKGKGLGKRKKDKEAEGEEEEGEMWLLLFDPGKPVPPDLKRAAASLASCSPPAPPSTSSTPDSASLSASTASSVSTLPPPKKLKPSATLSSRGGFGSSTTKSDGAEDGPKYGSVLKVFRVNMRELKRREEYQILYVEPGPPLSAAEKAQRREVKSKMGTPASSGGTEARRA
ncbi:hypothetical protein JCM10207_002976 [Rhodosporidiobolus poonsookiae]